MSEIVYDMSISAKGMGWYSVAHNPQLVNAIDNKLTTTYSHNFSLVCLLTIQTWRLQTTLIKSPSCSLPSTTRNSRCKFVEQRPTAALRISCCRRAVSCRSSSHRGTTILDHASMNSATARHHASQAWRGLRRRYIGPRCHTETITTYYAQHI